MTAERFWSKVNKTDGCWFWMAATKGNGYGHLWWGGRYQGAHRVAYQLEMGAIPKGLEIDHLCRVRHCVRPSHLEPVTRRENVLRGVSLAAVRAVVTHCPQGHEYTAATTYLSAKRQRTCSICAKARGRRPEELERSRVRSAIRRARLRETV